jgi:hypothetical protein
MLHPDFLWGVPPDEDDVDVCIGGGGGGRWHTFWPCTMLHE